VLDLKGEDLTSSCGSSVQSMNRGQGEPEAFFKQHLHELSFFVGFELKCSLMKSAEGMRIRAHYESSSVEFFDVPTSIMS